MYFLIRILNNANFSALSDCTVVENLPGTEEKKGSLSLGLKDGGIQESLPRPGGT